MEKEVLKHYGTPRHSGRYPWGSGKKPQRHYDFLARVKDLDKRGLSETEIYKELGFKSSVEFRAAKRIANNEVQKWEISEVNRLLAEGKNKSEIGRIMGKNESSIRSIINKKLAVEGDLTTATSNMLKDALAKSKYIDIGDGVENNLGPTGISKERLRVAVKMLEQEGYETINVQINQLGTKDGQKTTLKVLAPPGTTYRDVKNDTENIDSVWFTTKHTEDGGYTFKDFEKPQSIDSKRILIKYGEEGSLKDGVIEIRPGLEDLNMGSARYAQVRVAVDEKYYLKGMCVYSNDIPAGYDVYSLCNEYGYCAFLSAAHILGSQWID